MKHNSCTSTEEANDSRSTQTVELELEQGTLRQLEQRLPEYNRCSEELVSSLLSETRDTVTLTEFVKLLLDQTNPAQIALHEGRSSLCFVVNSGIDPDVDSIRQGIHAIDVDGEEYLYSIIVDPYGPQDLGRYNLFEAGDLENLDEETLLERVDEAKAWMKTEDNLKSL